MVTEKVDLEGIIPLHLFGIKDKNLRLLSKNYGISIVPRGEQIIITGEKEEIKSARKCLDTLVHEIKKGKIVDEEEIKYLFEHNRCRKGFLTPNIGTGKSLLLHQGLVKPKTPGQEGYLKALEKYDIVICIGPAGTGKTYLSIAKAVWLLKNKLTRRIILARPAVEAGERLGFLPGDLKEKVDPYLRPLYDALYELLPHSEIRKNIDERNIEVAPLAYMRGRNISNSFVILDEAQNTTKLQMKMFLTRLGVNSKACITGDVTQIDLGNGRESGLIHITNILKDIKGIKIVHLTQEDIVRHKLVKEIVQAYERENSKS